MTQTESGGPSFERKVPEGDDHPRLVCTDCGFINYENPKIVVGAVVSWEEQILLCRRAIEPRAGYWTIPAGYMELHETATDGACREAWEEARARIEIDQLMAVYSIPRISQIQLIYRARLTDPVFGPGPESVEVGLYRWSDIPWDDLAFPSVHWALNHFHDLRGEGVFAPRGNPPSSSG